MKKIIIILVCLLLLTAGVPLFAQEQGGEHGRFWKDNPNRWQGSSTHPAVHGWRGWGEAPCRAPDGIPTEDPPGDPGNNPGKKSGEKPIEKPKVEPKESLEGKSSLGLGKGGFRG